MKNKKNNIESNINHFKQSAIYNDGNMMTEYNKKELHNTHDKSIEEDNVGTIILEEIDNSQFKSNKEEDPGKIIFDFGSIIHYQYFRAQHIDYVAEVLAGYHQFRIMNIGKTIKSKEVQLDLMIFSFVSDLIVLQCQKLSNTLNSVCEVIKETNQ